MATVLLSRFALVLTVATVAGCEKKPESPDYAQLQSELASSLGPIAGWAVSDIEVSTEGMRANHRAKVTEIISRTYKSELNGQEVQMHLVGGHRGDISRYVPDAPGAMVGSPYEGHNTETLNSHGVAYAFSCAVQTRPDHRHVLWTHMSRGSWNRWWMNIALDSDPYSFTVWFEVISPPNTKPNEIPSATKALIAKIMDQISPAVIVHHLANTTKFSKWKG
jgi:hypothetical protein